MNLDEFFFYKHPEYVLTDAVECSAIDYWANISKIIRNDEGMIMSFVISPAEGDDFNETLVTQKHIKEGIENIFNKGFIVGKHIIKELVEDDVDAEGCDCIIQASLFHQLTYA